MTGNNPRVKKKTRHINIPVFIPHLGCPHTCVFCNQRTITGRAKFDVGLVRDEIETALSTISAGAGVEIAFFGGSFTGIDRRLMVYLLDVAKQFVDSGRVGSIRLSTRPDYIDREILDLLKKYPVRTIELGIQSMDDRVLAASRRGHTSKDTETACRLIKEYGLELVGQMMVGLPGADLKSEVMTAREICRLEADGARVYPTVVFQGTGLAAMTAAGEYTPLDTEEAVCRTKEVLKVFAEQKVQVIRVGLCASEQLVSDTEVLGGASHAALGELAMGELYYELVCRELDRNRPPTGGNLVVFVPEGEISKATGHKKRNRERLMSRYSLRGIVFYEDPGLEPYQIKLSSDTL
ncbi:MAG TPA: radical SAM protein [Clostridiales bacterium]|jgi:histone acetyltransferase (RNA polymerase elongator complex component)|nr:radical SAM protein [Clostridiales bacterium]